LAFLFCDANFCIFYIFCLSAKLNICRVFQSMLWLSNTFEHDWVYFSINVFTVLVTNCLPVQVATRFQCWWISMHFLPSSILAINHYCVVAEHRSPSILLLLFSIQSYDNYTDCSVYYSPVIASFQRHRFMVIDKRKSTEKNTGQHLL